MSDDSLVIDDINESELSDDAGDVYLFQWLSSTEGKLSKASLTELKMKQSTLEDTFTKIISGTTENYPQPGRAIRNLIGRCFVLLYMRGETKSMFDTLQSLLKVVGDLKSMDKVIVKTAAFSCIGDIMAVFGSQVMSFMAEICVVTVKTCKSSSSCLLRYHALIALAKSLKTAKKAVQDSSIKDIMKQMRSALSDKSLPVQRAASEVIIAMYSFPDPVLLASSEIEPFLFQCVKSLDGADQLTRHSHAQLIGHILAASQIERAIPSPEAVPKNTNKDANSDGRQIDEDDANNISGATEMTKPLLTPQEMLLLLSTHFNKPSTSRKARIGMFDFYAALLTKLGPGFCETNFSLIASHLFSEIISNSRLTSPNPNVGMSTLRYEKLLFRTLVGILLRDLVGVRMLSEQGQIAAIQELANVYLKRWPPMMPGQVAPSSAVFVCVLKEIAGLLQQLGNSPPPVQNALADPLITLLSHPSHSVRVTAAWTLRCFCFSTPLRLPRTIITLMDKLQRDLSGILTPTASSDISFRALGHAYALSALISIIPKRPLYVSYDVAAKVLDMATQLLKRAGEHEVRIADVEVEAAWMLIASLMTLGPNFVRPHLAQLLVLWRNALPKPTSKDAIGGTGRSVAEWDFLLHVREAALGAMWCFLERNKGVLVTLDVARRIANVLINALSFANNFISIGVEDPAESALLQQGPSRRNGGLTLREREALLRTRIHQCFNSLGFSSIQSSTQIIILQSALSLFASPEGYAGSSVQAAIASSTGTFISVWASADGYGYGVTGDEIIDMGGVEDVIDSGASGIISEQGESSRNNQGNDYLNRDMVEVAIDTLIRKPILGACEHDPLALCQLSLSAMETETYRLIDSYPPTTSVVDTAIDLFAKLVPLQDLPSTQKILSTLLEYVRSPKLEKNAGRKAAVWVNANVALVLSLRGLTSGIAGYKQAKETFGSSTVTSLISPFLTESLISGDLVLRSTSSESIGRLASLSGTNYLTSQIKDLVDQVVNNRNPNGRAGCALAFGAIYSHVGGLAAGPLLKTTVNILLSLANDPHPTVHFWSLNALARVINAASLAYAPFVSGTLGMLLKIYLTESHEREGGTLANANLSGDFPAYPIACQIIDSIITVLGPDIQESTRTRTLVQSLVNEFLKGEVEDEGICVEAIKCIQHFLMFASDHADVPDLVQCFRGHLSSTTRRPLKIASINALYQLVQKDALAMSKLGGDGLVEDLFGLLDDDQHPTSVQGVRNVISSWLKQTVVFNPSAWIDLCQRIMARTTASQQVADAAADQQQQQNQRDDEGESLNVGGEDTARAATRDTQVGSVRRSRKLTSRWRTQLFALHCLHDICSIVATSGGKEHLNAIVARQRGLLSTNGLLFSRVADLIKMAFTASTAYVTEIRLAGLIVLRDVIETFAASPDPAYDDALLLEQHQAPITAALTPAFSSDSTPEILASAVHACAIFVGCGAVRDVGRMGRILKLLITALDQSKGGHLAAVRLSTQSKYLESGMLSLGETGELSPNASAMLRISTLSAWAQLQVASVQQAYLEDVVKPYRPALSSLWIAALRDYACIRIDSEFLHDTSSVALDSSYSNLGKEVLLPYYSTSWSIILQAVASAMQANDPHILAAMNGTEIKEKTQAPTLTATRKEPTSFFYVIFGLIYEALATSSACATSSTTRQASIVSALQALKYLVRPEYSGNAILEPTIFDEFIGLCYRMGMTEAPAVQIHLVEMLSVFAGAQSTTLAGSDPLTLTSPPAHCLRICSNILKQATSSRVSVTQGHLSDRVAIISSSINAFASIAAAIPSSNREDVRAVAVLLYTGLLKDETSEIDFVGPTLPALKTLLDLPVSTGNDKDRYSRLIHALLSTCLLNIDSLRGRTGVISTKKIKNNMLAAVLVMTVVPSWVRVGRAVIEHACYLISQKLLEKNELSLTMAHCSKTLILASSSGSSTLHQCTRLLIPGLVEFTAKIAPSVHEGTVTEGQAASISEVWKAFAALHTSTPEKLRSRLLGVLLPTISLLLTSNPTSQPLAASVIDQTVAQLLSFATTSPSAFKEAAATLDPSIHELLELVIRRAVGGSTSMHNTTQMKPQISLRSF